MQGVSQSERGELADQTDDRIAIGRIRTSHGVHGDLKVESYSGETEHFARLSEVELRREGRSRVFRVQRVRASSGHLLLKLEGIDTPEEARAFSNWDIVVDRPEAAPLRNDEYYLTDLCRCAVVKEGRELGRIISVCEGGGGEMLEIEVSPGRRYFVPFRKEFIGTVDVDRQFVELEADWLLQ